MRLPTIATLENPRPKPPAFQSNVGPPSGHLLSKPLSGEISSRLGPRHCGQSVAPSPLAIGRLSAARLNRHQLATRENRNSATVRPIIKDSFEAGFGSGGG